MNIDKAFIKALKHYYKGEDVVIVAYYEEAKALLNRLVALPETYLDSIEIHHPDTNGYLDTFTISLSANGAIWCEPSVLSSGNVGASGGYVMVDGFVENPERFGIAGESVVKVVK